MKQIPCPLSEAARLYGGRPAVICGYRTLSYAQLNHCVLATIRFLEAIGLKRNQRVAIVDTNRLEYLIVLLALWRMKAVGCPLSHRFPEATLLKILENINCRLVMSSDQKIFGFQRIPFRKLRFEDVVSSLVRRIGRVGTGFPGPPVAMARAGKPVPTKILLDQPATIVHTSGTGNAPKAVLHTYGNHYFNALGANENMPLHSGDRWLLSLPLYHVGGLGILFRVLLGKAAIVVPSKDEGLSETILKYKVTHLSLVATQLYRLLHDQQNQLNLKRLSRLKAILVGGGPVPTSILKESLQWRLSIYLTYGLTETASQVATSSQAISDLSSSQVRVLNHRELKISRQGEIWVKGPALFKGYVKNGKIVLPLKDKGWFATGDVGSITPDGRLSVVGRRDNMFISGGENIHPEEIERRLFDLEGIEQALVVPVVEEEYGFRPVAFLKTRPKAKIRLDALHNHLEKYLPRFKIPISFYQWPPHIPPGSLKENRRYFQGLVQEKQKTFMKIS